MTEAAEEAPIPDPVARALLGREHNDAIARLDPRQVRAVQRLIAAGARATELDRDEPFQVSEILNEAVALEALEMPKPSPTPFPEWWWAR